MKILFIASGYLPYTFSENLCNAKLVYALQEAGWHVDVISKKDNDRLIVQNGKNHGCH